MNFLNYKNIGMMIIIMIVGVFLLTIFSYFNFINNKALNILEIILACSAMFVGGFNTGKNSKEKGWLEGLKLGIVFSIFFVLLNIIFIHNFEIKNIIYYIIIVISSIFGSMIGISKKATK